MAQFKPKEVLSSNLDTTKVVTGQMILVSDIGDLYFDSAASGRIHVSGIIPINVNEYYSNYSDEEKLAFCKKYKNCLILDISKNIIYGYSNGTDLIFTAPHVNTYKHKLTSDTTDIIINGFNPNTDNLKIYLNGILLMQSLDYIVYLSSDNTYYVKFLSGISASSSEPAFLYIEINSNMGYTEIDPS